MRLLQFSVSAQIKTVTALHTGSSLERSHLFTIEIFQTIKKSGCLSLKLISPNFLEFIYFSFENDSFEGIKNNPGLLTAIQMSIINQAETLTRTMEAGDETQLYQCSSCRLSVEEEQGEHPCSHCGQIMEVRAQRNTDIEKVGFN